MEINAKGPDGGLDGGTVCGDERTGTDMNDASVVLPEGRPGVLNPQYKPNPAIVNRIHKNFTYHSPTGLQPHRYNVIRQAFKELAMLLAEQCPDSREFAIAITSLEEASMWANAAIARNE